MTFADIKGLVQFTEESVMAYVMYRDTANQWRWYLSASNGRKLANSGEGYHNKSDCLAAIYLVRGSDAAPIYEQ